MREINQSILSGENLYEQLCSLELMRGAFKKVKQNKGACGIDGITVSVFQEKLEDNLKQIVHELETWKYRPSPVRRVEIPKPTGGVRLLGIPCIRDRVVQAALKMLLEPILDPTFSENSYGFREMISADQAVQAAKQIVKSGKEYVVDIDLEKFFDKINHDKLISRLNLYITDKCILRIIGMTLRSGIMQNGLITRTTEGSVQGSPLSPLLSNLVLDELDKELEKRNLEFCRYADDCNIFVQTQKAANRVMCSITKFIENKLKLKVNKEKSKVALSDKIKFLGMTIVMATLAISATSMNRAMTKVKELTPRGTHIDLRQTIQRFNKWYVGWTNYYKMTEYPAQFYSIEAHFRRRLRARIVCQQKQRRTLCKLLISKGVTRSKAARTAYSNKGKWALSHTRAMETAYPNKWFEMMGMKIRSGDQHSHWHVRTKWIKLT